MRCYQTNRLQRCEINNHFGEWAKISAGVPQGSIISPLLFNIFINDIFLLLQKCYLANYADDSTMYTSDKRVSTIIGSLRHEFTILSKWFYNKFMVCNPEKRSFMLIGVDNPLQNQPGMWWSNSWKKIQEKLLGVTLDNKLNFATHLLNITKNANKFNALTWVQKYMTTNQKSLYFPPLLNRNLPTVRWYGCFVQNVPFAE